MKILKVSGKVLLFGAGLVIVLLVFSVIYHNYQLRTEAEEYPPPGELVEVNDNKMHVYSEGYGDITFVFLPGGGSFIPTIDFKPLWVGLTENYRIAVVERAGYGWSETSSEPRDIDTMLRETIRALELSGGR